MKKSIYFILPALLIITLVYSACQPATGSQPDTTKDIEAVKAVMKNAEANWNAGKSIADHYTDDIVAMPPGEVVNLSKEVSVKRLEAFLADNISIWTIDVLTMSRYPVIWP